MRIRRSMEPCLPVDQFVALSGTTPAARTPTAWSATSPPRPRSAASRSQPLWSTSSLTKSNSSRRRWPPATSALDRHLRRDRHVSEADARDAELVRLLLFSGLCLGELRALKWGSLDLESRALFVRFAFSAGKAGLAPAARWNALKLTSERGRCGGPDTCWVQALVSCPNLKGGVAFAVLRFGTVGDG